MCGVMCDGVGVEEKSGSGREVWREQRHTSIPFNTLD